MLAGFVFFLAMAQLVPLAFAVDEDHEQFHTARGFTISLLASLGLSVALWLFGRRAGNDFSRREGMAVVGFSWLLAGVLGGLAFFLTGALQSFADAFFESVSGLTTTGSSVFSTATNPLIEDLPPSVVLWRAMLQWLGGLGIILVFIVLLPVAGISGKTLLDSEQVGVSTGRMRPSQRKNANNLFKLYLALSTAATLSFWLAGMTWFESVCHAFTTMATGGFSTKNASIGSFQSATIEIVAIIFMFLAGCNFATLISCYRGKFRRSANPFANPELRFYLLITLSFVATTTAILWIWGQPLQDPSLALTREYNSFGRCLRDGAFQVVSILTSTGFSSADFQNWPKAAVFILVLCMFIGGCSGSTAGGLKIFRVLIIGKVIANAVRRFIQPNRVEKIKVKKESVADNIVAATMALAVMWFVTVAIGTFALAMDPRLDLISAFTANASMLGCTGPAVTAVIPHIDGTYEIANSGMINLGPYGGFGELGAGTKVFLALEMILGRLEILAPIVLLAPSFWRR